MKKIMSVVMIMMLVLVLAACGANTSATNDTDNNDSANNEVTSGDDNDANGDSDSEQDDTQEAQALLDQIKTDGVLKIGTEGTYAPFTFHNEEGELTGFDVDVAREVASRLDLEAQFVETKWDGMFAGLDAKRFDMVANEVGIRDDRKEKYDFSDPYIQSKAVLIVNADDDSIQSFEDLKGKNAGQSLTSNYGDLARSYGAEIVAVDGFNQSVDLLLSGRIDGTINDSLSYYDFVKQRPDVALKIADSADNSAQSGFMFRKGNEALVDAVNGALKAMIEDGTYSEISQKWFGEDVLN